MADAFQVWLGGSTHLLGLTHPFVMLAGRHHETVLPSSSFVPHPHTGLVRSKDDDNSSDNRRDASTVGRACQRRISLVWKRGWMAVVLIEIGLREISQSDIGEVAGERSGEQVSSEDEAQIKIGIAGLMPQAARLRSASPTQIGQRTPKRR